MDAPEIEEGQGGEDGRDPSRQGLRQAAVLLYEKCPPDEATGFKLWLMDIAQAVAGPTKKTAILVLAV